MGCDFNRIDPQLRTVGRVSKLIARPSRRGFKALQMLIKRSSVAEMSDAESRTVWVDRSDGNGELRVRVFRPNSVTEPLPIVVYLHGGGYAVGTPEQDSCMSMFAGLMSARPCVVVAPNYRLSLDAPYPSGVDDCYDALLWAKEHSSEIGGRADQIFVAGDSAGGGLTAALCLMARDRGDVNIAFQMPLYPMIDHRQTNPSAVDNEMPIWNSAFNRVAWELYLSGLERRGEAVPAYASPALADSFAGLPPAVTFVGDCDPFLDETIAYVEALRGEGVAVDFEVFPGCYHGFDQIVPTADQSVAANSFLNQAFADAVDRHFAPQSTSGISGT